jgi:hypothetical protein
MWISGSLDLFGLECVRSMQWVAASGDRLATLVGRDGNLEMAYLKCASTTVRQRSFFQISSSIAEHTSDVLQSWFLRVEWGSLVEMADMGGYVYYLPAAFRGWQMRGWAEGWAALTPVPFPSPLLCTKFSCCQWAGNSGICPIGKFSS